MGTQCYFPDGAPDPEGVPCNSTAVGLGRVSSCCGRNSICYANGPCAPSPDQTPYRRSCTDGTWGSSACSHLCLGPPNGTEISIRKCPALGGKACCNREGQGDCCDGDGYFFEYKPGEITHYIVNGTSTAGSAPPKDVVEWPEVPWYRDTTVIGLLAGIGGAFALLLGIIVVIWRRRRGLRDRTTSSTTGTPSTAGMQGKK